MSANIINYSTLNSEHNWDDLYISNKDVYKNVFIITILNKGRFEF